MESFGLFGLDIYNIDGGELYYLSNTGGQEVDDPLVRDGHYALAVDLNDPVPHPHAPSLRNSSPQQTADLK